MAFGDNLRKARKAKKISQTSLAQMLGVAQRTISSYETEISIPRSSSLLRQIAEILDLSPAELVAGDERFVMYEQEQYAKDSKHEAKQIVRRLSAIFSSGEVTPDEMDELALSVQEAYVKAKKKIRE